MNKIERDWVNSPKHILHQKINALEIDALVAIISENKKKFKRAMLKLSKLYDEDK